MDVRINFKPVETHDIEQIKDLKQKSTKRQILE